MEIIVGFTQKVNVGCSLFVRKIYIQIIQVSNMKYTIKYTRTKCIGAGNCVQIAPETWELDSDGLAKLKIKEYY